MGRIGESKEVPLHKFMDKFGYHSVTDESFVYAISLHYNISIEKSTIIWKAVKQSLLTKLRELSNKDILVIEEFVTFQKQHKNVKAIFAKKFIKEMNQNAKSEPALEVPPTDFGRSRWAGGDYYLHTEPF